jgi:hypothetical protein
MIPTKKKVNTIILRLFLSRILPGVSLRGMCIGITKKNFSSYISGTDAADQGPIKKAEPAGKGTCQTRAKKLFGGTGKNSTDL